MTKLLPLLAICSGVAALHAAQTVEGFASLLSSPGANSRPAAIPVDFRGAAPGHVTAPWWTTGPHGKLEWRTASVPRQEDTIFVFTGASSVIPAEFSRGPKATLYLEGKPAITFDIGQARNRTWSKEEIRLDYEAKRSEWPFTTAHRQFYLNGDSGLYSLHVPAKYISAGQAATLALDLAPFPQWPNAWFMVKERTDSLRDDPEVLREQVRQLQSDMSKMAEFVQVLATGQYASMLDTRDMRHSVVYTNGWRHLHPADLIALQNGELLLTTREGSEHISRDGEVILVRSTDGGKTWGDKQVIAAIPDLEEREGCGIQLKDGTVLVFVFYNALYRANGEYEWNWSKEVAFGKGKTWLGTYVLSSKDKGNTWSKPSYIDTKGMPFTDIEGPADAPIEMPDGSIVLPVMAYNVRGDIRNQAAVLLRSTDKGVTWSYVATMAQDPGGKLGGFAEPGLARTRTGRLVTALRNAGPENAIWVSWSDDDGKTWTRPKQTPMIGHPADLVQLADGRLLCTYGSRPDRHANPGGIRASFSKDNGETWTSEEVLIRRDFLNIDIGYPESMQMPDGRILTVYYFNLFGRYFIGQTMWKP
jgi:sialidase-1